MAIWPGRFGIRFLGGAREFVFSATCRLAVRNPKPPIQYIQGFLISKVQQLGCEADHSLPPNAQVKNQFSYTSTPTTCLCGKHRHNFTLYTMHIKQLNGSNR
jgi:hypothetical protein